MSLVVHASIREIESSQWDALVRNNYPFLQHAFLDALEQNHCIGDHVGWIPHYLAYRENDVLKGAMPLFEKHNSWGEFVFDHAWANAWHRSGLEYYPKLVNSIPFTPATGQRLLTDNENSSDITCALLEGAGELATSLGASGIHILFPDAQDFSLIQNKSWIERNDCQFHWQNQGYGHFEDFLDTLKSRKRKKIRHERHRAKKQDIEILALDGHTATRTDWTEFVFLFQLIYQRKWGAPAFNVPFFEAVSRDLPDSIRLVLVRKAGQAVAGAVMYLDDTTLYGRHWGCSEYLDCLHFEVCYYQGIDICIQSGLHKFDPGAQGEHKLARGFLPTQTRSLHKMTHSPFNSAIRQFAQHESESVANYIQTLAQYSPYRDQPGNETGF